MNPARRPSFRFRLALQTVLVAGIVVTGFGAGAWWYAKDQRARNHDLRIAQAARRLWGQLTPRHREEDFVQAVRATFARDEVPVAVTIVWHVEGQPAATITGPKNDGAQRAAFLRYLPQGPAVVTRAIENDGPPRQARALSPEIGQAGAQRRPQMPEIRRSDFFTLRTAAGDWRYGTFSNPHYTVFVGLAENDLHAAARRAAAWFAGMGTLALLLAGLGAWWASGRAIRPLARIVAISNRMDAGNLDERIPLHARDDREFGQLIHALNNMTARLRDSFAQSARFTADASHELRTPLAVMQTTLNEILRAPSSDDDTRERLGVVLHQVSHLKQITHRLLLLSQADAGALPVKPERYDLSQDLAGPLEDAKSLCAEAGLAFEQAIEPAVFVEADRALMQQVFQNLVSNAIKHNRPDGTVRVQLSGSENGVKFEISNTSAELNDEAKRRLFERFFRTDTARRSDGFGLGLNIARELSRACGAKLKLAQSPAGTTAFVVTFASLPAATAGVSGRRAGRLGRICGALNRW